MISNWNNFIVENMDIQFFKNIFSELSDDYHFTLRRGFLITNSSREEEWYDFSYLLQKYGFCVSDRYSDTLKIKSDTYCTVYARHSSPTLTPSKDRKEIEGFMNSRKEILLDEKLKMMYQIFDGSHGIIINIIIQKI